MGMRQAARGPRSGKAEILTGVLTATRCDPQVKAPVPGFYTGSRPTDGRRLRQPAHTLPPRRPPRSTKPSPHAAANPSQPQPAPSPFPPARPSTQMSWLLKGFRRWAPARPVSRPDHQPATGPPGSYPDRTFTGRRRRASDQVMIAGQSPPDALGARNFGLKGFRRWAPARPVSRPDHQPATGPPGSYPDRTFTGRRRRASDQVMIAGQSPPDALGAR